jgi:hypothetical protein
MDRDGQDAFSYPTVTDWPREFDGGSTSAEDVPRPGKLPDFVTLLTSLTTKLQQCFMS